MKTIVTAIGLAALQTLIPQNACAQTQTTEETEVEVSPDGTTTTTTTTTTFKPEVRNRVVTYFDTFKTQKYGLPPGFFGIVKVEQIPATWRANRIPPGIVVAEPQREYLVAAPPELVKLLPPPDEVEVRYFVAGSNVIAVNEEYKVVDSIQIPSINIEVDD